MPNEPAESRKLLPLIWGITVATYLLTGRGADHGLSTDDAMRLVRARDLIAGQGWFGVTQYRLNPPAGVALHWSRLIDLPIAILLRAVELVLPSATAQRLVLIFAVITAAAAATLPAGRPSTSTRPSSC